MSKKYISVTLTMFFKPTDINSQILTIDQINTIQFYTNKVINNNSIRDLVIDLNITPMKYMEHIASYWGILHSAKWISNNVIECIILLDNRYINIGKRDIVITLVTNSLEDGEYESSESNGWTLKTPSGYEYGLVDYRKRENIIIKDHNIISISI
jgi:hypothetical protein